MRLYISGEKEAQVLQIALARFVATETNDQGDIAQALLERTARCLELQGNAHTPSDKGG